MSRIEGWLGRDVVIVATGERGRVTGIPLTADDSITLVVAIGEERGWCPHRDCPRHRSAVFTIRDGQKSPVRKVRKRVSRE